jgi:hypothetical protein
MGGVSVGVDGLAVVVEEALVEEVELVLVGASRQEQKVFAIDPASEIRLESKDALGSSVLVDELVVFVSVLVLVGLVVVFIVVLGFVVDAVGALRLP